MIAIRGQPGQLDALGQVFLIDLYLEPKAVQRRPPTAQVFVLCIAINLKRSPIIICKIGSRASCGIETNPVTGSPYPSKLIRHQTA